MSEWRDARLQRALQDAPDADMLPSERTRRAILAQARDAVAPARAAPWWKTFWQGMGSRQMPWNAAFATVVVATLVTVLWHDREVPDARTETAVADRQAPAPAASAAVTAPAPPPATTPPPANAAKPAAVAPVPAEPATQAPTRRDGLPARKKQAADSVQASAPAVAPESPAPAAAPPPLAAAPQAAEAKRERRAEAATGALRNEQGGALSKAAPREAEQTRQADRAVAEQAPAQATATVQSAPAIAPAPAPAAAAPAAAAPPARAAVTPQAKSAGPQFSPSAPAGAAAPAAGLSAQLNATSPAPTADTLVLASEGRTAQIPASQAARLLDMVNRMGRDAQSGDPLREPVTLRIELRQQGQPIGLLELAGRQVRWTQWRDGVSRSATTRPDDAQLQALRDEFRRLLER